MSKHIWDIYIASSNVSSALITLYESSFRAGPSAYVVGAGQDLRELGTTGLDFLLPKVAAYAMHIQTILPYNIDQSSPLIANCLYRMAVRFSEMSSNNGISRTEYSTVLKSIRDTLQKLDSRWKVAGKNVPGYAGYIC
jgi:hypothetical protein